MAEFVGFGMFMGVFLGAIWLGKWADDKREARRLERRKLEIARQVALFEGIQSARRRHLQASRRELA